MRKPATGYRVVEEENVRLLEEAERALPEGSPGRGASQVIL